VNTLDTIVITGAGRGIGRAAALDLASTGAHVLCISQSANARDTADRIEAQGGSASSLSIDLADYRGAEMAVRDWIAGRPAKRLGVVLAAAILGKAGPLIETDLETWDLAYRVGVLGNLAVLKALLPQLVETGFGRIVGFAGGGSAYANPTFPAYSAAKTAMVRIVENLHEDLKDRGNFASVCLAPGAVETDMLQAVRDSGGYVKTTVGMDEPVGFIRGFLTAESCGFSGCFVHVRDSYQYLLNSGEKIPSDARWKLRRIEPAR
jgi:NAD(P)-dependent dehydrogenase (short-subunit alcohol dehydrogenase family)